MFCQLNIVDKTYYFVNWAEYSRNNLLVFGDEQLLAMIMEQTEIL